MRRPCSIVVVCVLLCFGVSVAVPGEDMPETAYNESEALPYVSTTVFSIAAPKAVVPGPAVRGIVSLLRSGSLRRPATQCFDQRIDSSYPICESLTILNHALRC